MTTGPTSPDPTLLRRNLLALGRANARAAELVQSSAPRDDIVFLATDDGVPAATLGSGPDARQLCSRRRPLDEARKFAEDVDPAQTGAAVVLGFALGYHVAALAKRFNGTGLVIVYEPDVRLLRSVLERIDCTWFAEGNVAIITDAEDRAAVATLTSGFETVFAVGTRIIAHAPSKARLGDGAQTFSDNFTAVLKAVRTTLVTTFVQADVTMGNALGNVGPYAMAPGIEDLRDAARGRAAIVVSAGSSLRRNVELLKQPGIRDRVVIIAVQTVLKPLLAMGIKPHFVTALDYAQISKRFYEGLTPRDVEGVTLVCEAKGNPAIVRAFPGVVRFPADEWLDGLLGEQLARPMGAIKPGATVAHLAYYLARHLGCDPVILIGQDLGFTDGQYYGSGAVIHDTWGPELNEFRTLEMFEWERIVRMRRMLRKVTDHLGRTVYTDEQMATYLVQFEREFLQDSQRNLRIIDATEGGVAKKQTQVMSLNDALSTFAVGDPIVLPDPFSSSLESSARRDRVAKRLQQVRRDVWQIGQNAIAAAALLEQMLDIKDDTRRLNQLIDRAQDLAKKSHALRTAYNLVHLLNQTGSFNRYKADRALSIDAGLSETEKQRLSIQRDLINVRWLADSAEEVGRMLALATERVEAEAAGPVIHCDEIRMLPREQGTEAGTSVVAAAPTRVRVEALICVDTRIGGMGIARDLGREPWRAHLPAGSNPLRLTMQRLLRCAQLDGITLITHEPQRVRDLLGPLANHASITLTTVDEPALKPRIAALRARNFSRSSWRGGVANLSIMDECFAPSLFARLMAERNIDAALLVGADWSLVDPALTDAIIARHREDPKNFRLVFTQAAPGLCGSLISREMTQEIAQSSRGLGSMASIGALLGYLPVFPQVDPIAKPSCVLVPPVVRDLYQRIIADDPAGIRAISTACAALGDCITTADAESIARAIDSAPRLRMPRELVIESTTRRLSRGLRDTWSSSVPPDLDLSLAHAQLVLQALGPERASVAVSIAGRGDPLLSSRGIALARTCRAAGIAALHLRTDLNVDPARVEALLDECRDVPIDILSVDVLAEKAETYAAITGTDALARVQANVSRLIAMRGLSDHGLPTPFIVPRMTRCDLVYEEVEPFYDRWTHESGCAVLDPLPRPQPHQRIDPITIPARARTWRDTGIIRLLADGTLCDATGAPIGHAENADDALRFWMRSNDSDLELKPALAGALA